jgi:hypothetical protein
MWFKLFSIFRGGGGGGGGVGECLSMFFICLFLPSLAYMIYKCSSLRGSVSRVIRVCKSQ